MEPDRPAAAAVQLPRPVHLAVVSEELGRVGGRHAGPQRSILLIELVGELIDLVGEPVPQPPLFASRLGAVQRTKRGADASRALIVPIRPRFGGRQNVRHAKKVDWKWTNC